MEAEETDLLPRLAFFPENLEAGRRPQPDLLGSPAGACRRPRRLDWLQPQRAALSKLGLSQNCKHGVFPFLLKTPTAFREVFGLRMNKKLFCPEPNI